MDAVHPWNENAVTTTQKDEPAPYLSPDIKMNCSQEKLIISGPLSQDSSHTIISIYRSVIHISFHLQICQFSFITIEPNGWPIGSKLFRSLKDAKFSQVDF